MSRQKSANKQVFNIREQRAILLAFSQAMYDWQHEVVLA